MGLRIRYAINVRLVIAPMIDSILLRLSIAALVNREGGRWRDGASGVGVRYGVRVWLLTFKLFEC